MRRSGPPGGKYEKNKAKVEQTLANAGILGSGPDCVVIDFDLITLGGRSDGLVLASAQDLRHAAYRRSFDF